MRQTGRSARVNHCACVNRSPIAQRNPAGRHMRNVAARQHRRGRQRGAHDRIQPRAGDAVIGCAQVAANRGKAHLVIIPARRNQGLDQRGSAWRQVGGEKRPDVIAAQSIAALDHHNAQVRPQFGQCQRNQAPGQSAAEHGDICCQAIHPAATLAKRFGNATSARWAAGSCGGQMGGGQRGVATGGRPRGGIAPLLWRRPRPGRRARKGF